jgi:hypothetical protein
MRRFFARVLPWAAAWSLFSLPARALENSELEERCVTRALGPKPDRDGAPEGKRIESVEIVRQKVFDDDDPVPDFVNIFHAQTREPMIRQELLFKPGDAYDADLVQETIRNLQALPQFGVVVIVPLKGKAPGSVRLIVIVRDVWSLRLGYQLQGTIASGLNVPIAGGGAFLPSLPVRASGNINYLFVNPSETNFLGTRTQLGGIFTLQPDRYSAGGLVIHPRIMGSKVDGLALARVFVNRDSGESEGSAGVISVYRDLIALSDKWSFLMGSAWDIEQTRVYSGTVLQVSDQGIPLVYHTSIVRGGAQLTRSFGHALKFMLTGGIEMNRREFEAERDPETTQRDFAAFVHDELPVSDTRISPFAQLEHKTTRFLATRDVETLSLQESFSLGEQAALRVYPALRDAGSSRNLLGTVAWLGYTWPVASGLVRLIGNSSIEQADQARHQASAQGALRFVSPRFGFVRTVVDSALVATYQNYLNRKLVLGGDSRPRGYQAAAFRGASGFATSFELRTTAVNILSARVGAVAFYDVGGTGEYVSSIKLRQSVGAGVRILFPQVNRQCFRLDWGAPLTRGPGLPLGPFPGGFFFTFGQAFDLPQMKLPQVTGAETTLLELAQ